LKFKPSLGVDCWGGASDVQADPSDTSKLAELPPAYIDTVINCMHAVEDDSLARKKKVAEQEKALLRLKRVMEARLRSSAAEEVGFDASLDDDETLLRLMHAVDSLNGNGAISKQELLDSPHLTAEMKKALETAFACNLEAVEEALTQVDPEDFGGYKKETTPVATGISFDRKASVAAIFAALDPSASGWVDKAGLDRHAAKLQDAGNEKLASALRGLSSTLLAADAELDFLAVKRESRRVPRVTGQRVNWARGLGLDVALARQLPTGTLEDGLAGVRAMPVDEAKRAVDAFLEDARAKIYKALGEAKAAQGSRSAVEANSKFSGFQGSFASLQDFHAGAEASLHLGYPNPDTMKGILNEHTEHPSATKFFVTSNYRIVTCLLIEYAFAIFEENPEQPSDKKVLDRAHKLLGELSSARNCDKSASDHARLLFPGEVGDSFAESLFVLSFPGLSAAADTNFGDKVKSEAVKLLKTVEEQVRGVTILDHMACMERIRKETSVMLTEPNMQAAPDIGSQRVGVQLPMSSVRAEAIRDQLLDNVKAAVGQEVVAGRATEITWSFSRFTSVSQLRQWLEEQNLADLLRRVVLKHEKEWAYVDHAAGLWSYDSLCNAMVSSFVRTELQADLRAALKSSNLSEAQIKSLLLAWNLEAVEALDEESWSKVEGWVRLYQGRIQGRMRLGLKALLAREKAKIEQYKLTPSEILAGHIYTGANFVPLNGICRSFPRSILDLLKGDDTTPDNRMCTTLFCISSCLKKLAQATELPDSRCRISWVMLPNFFRPQAMRSQYE
jgi:hypothetical protein